MFLPSRPSPRDIERFLDDSRACGLSYEPIGLANGTDSSFDVDQETTVLGSGDAAYQRATRALSEWAHFRLGWVELFPAEAPIVPGSVVAVLIRHLGFWSLNGCRVVYGVGGPGQNEFGFAYGTLTNHAEAGEELFKVSFHPDSGEVVYVIRAASRPRATLARLGYPVVRSLQARFRFDSSQAMRRAVAG